MAELESLASSGSGGGGGGGGGGDGDAAAAGAGPDGVQWLQSLVQSNACTARCSANFLPKFNNQGEGERLAGSLVGLESRGCLLVSKKHSGSLLMAPPFYSKNGVANDFSRLGSRVMLEYMCAVWDEPTDNPETFARWWRDAEERGLCYSFELVVPRMLGDHGATPTAAYVVLTAVSHTPPSTTTRTSSPKATKRPRVDHEAGAAGQSFLSPAHLLALARKWRLPLNETWFFPGDRALAVEEALHRERWQLTDAGANPLLDSLGGHHQRFLGHSETQGDVLEGFVLMAVEADMEPLRRLIDGYNHEMAPLHGKVLARLQHLGELCSVQDPELKASLASPVPGGQFPEPKHLAAPSERLWDLWGAVSSAPGPLGRLFRRLRDSYQRQVSLKLYAYQPLSRPGKGMSLQVQVHVHNDQIFYGWPLHMKGEGCPPLFRGMVAQFDVENEPCSFSEDGVPEEAMRNCEVDALGLSDKDVAGAHLRIVAISKLKCLNYIWRTFGIRNQLSSLLSGGAEAFLSRTRKGFLRNWKVPVAEGERLLHLFARWARCVTSEMTEVERHSLGQRQYLAQLERFLARGGAAMETWHDQAAAADDAGEGGALSKLALALRRCFVVVVDLRSPPPAEQEAAKAPAGTLATEISPMTASLSAAGLMEGQRLESPRAAVQGYWTLTRVPPSPKLLSCHTSAAPVVVLVFGPEQGQLSDKDLVEDKVQRGHLTRMIKIWEAIQDKSKGLQAKYPAVPVFFNPSLDPDGSQLADELPEVGVDLVSDAPVASASRRKCTIIAVAGLPPGGGKSTLVKSLAAMAGDRLKVVSSDNLKKHFDQELARAVSTFDVVAFDKNLPNFRALAKLLRTVKPLMDKTVGGVDVSFIMVCPASLSYPTCWERIAQRDTRYALNIHTCSGGASGCEAVFRGFFQDCEKFLPQFQELPGAVITPAFFDPEQKATERLAATLLDPAQQTAPFPELQAVVDEAMDTGAGVALRADARVKGPVWASVDIPGTNLHMTVVPPRGSRTEASKNEVISRLAEIQGRSVNLVASSYVTASCKEGKQRRMVSFWRIVDTEGLDERHHLESQRQCYHITDLGSLGSTTRPSAAFEVLDELVQEEKQAAGAAEAPPRPRRWTTSVTLFDAPLQITGVLTLHGLVE